MAHVEHRRDRVSIALLWIAASLATLGACAPHVDATRMIVDRVRFHGVHQISEDDLSQRIATQESDRFLGVRLPWADPQYYDDTTFRRDLDRIERYYQAHGYYSAAVEQVRVAPTSANHHAIDVDVTVREGIATRVASLWISGCEPESIRATDRWRASPDTCTAIRAQMQLRAGAVFTDAAYDADRGLIADLLRDQGFATVRVVADATVDPVLHQAYVVYVLEPGPPSRFGRILLHEGIDAAMETGRLPHSHYPVTVIIRSTAIRRGAPYSRTALADAQRRLFGLGAFGIVRINEEPHLCDGHDRCDADRDTSDVHEYARVDLNVFLSPTRPYRIRVGGGAEADQSRSDVHLSASFEHFRVPFLGREARYRIEERPLVFLPFSFGGNSTNTFDVGNTLSQEFRIPEVWPGGALVASLVWDIGPDPINPGIIHRTAERGALGTVMQLGRHIRGSAWIRAVRLDYYTGTQIAVNADNPVFRDLYVPQTYTYLEQQISYDGRDSPLQTRRGVYASLVNQESFAVPGLSSYSFLRTSLDVRAYAPVGSHVVFALRGFVGAAIGLETQNCPERDLSEPSPQTHDGCLVGWPVPPELRFYSGGANSNRGYAFGQVGWQTAIPAKISDPSLAGSNAYVPPNNTNHNVGAFDTRFINVGGLTAWEVSAEMRLYFPPFGVVLFFDSSDVGGWDPAMANGAPNPGPSLPNSTPGAAPASRSLYFNGFDPHASVGFGLRYISPIGVVRLDLGLRLEDLRCIGQPTGTYSGDPIGGTYDTQVNATRTMYPVAQPSAQQYYSPAYYAVSQPSCQFLGLPLPLALQFAIGEAY